MTHDPLCPMGWGCSSPDDAAHNSDIFGLPCPQCERACICDTIAEVRADERMKAGQRVNSLPRGANISVAAAVAAGDVDAGVGW